MKTKARKRLVHIILDTNVLASKKALDETVDRIKAATGIEPSNYQRLTRYGILSGSLEEGKEQVLKKVSGVAAVEEDSAKTASRAE